MGQLGAKLKQARRDQGLSLEELKERTKIQKHYLEGIEADDYSAIPGAFYVRAFIKRYAAAVGLDGEDLLLAHKDELPEPEPESMPSEHLSRRPDKKKPSSGPASEAMPKILVALFIVFILLVIWYFYLLSTSGNDVEQGDGGGGVEYEAPSGQEPEDEPGQTPEEEQDAEPAPAEPAPEEPTGELELESVAGETTTYRFTGPTDKELDFTATGDSWLSVTDASGEELLALARVFEAGETETIDVSDEAAVFMRIGDYAMLEAELNGEQVPYEQEQKPQNIVIRFDDAE